MGIIGGRDRGIMRGRSILKRAAGPASFGRSVALDWVYEKSDSSSHGATMLPDGSVFGAWRDHVRIISSTGNLVHEAPNASFLRWHKDPFWDDEIGAVIAASDTNYIFVFNPDGTPRYYFGVGSSSAAGVHPYESHFWGMSPGQYRRIYRWDRYVSTTNGDYDASGRYRYDSPSGYDAATVVRGIENFLLIGTETGKFQVHDVTDSPATPRLSAAVSASKIVEMAVDPSRHRAVLGSWGPSGDTITVVDLLGNIIWSDRPGYHVDSLVVDKFGEIYASSGQTIQKYSVDGELVWAQPIPGSTYNDSGKNGLAVDESSGRLFVTGRGGKVASFVQG